jgi:hypothetical protein
MNWEWLSNINIGEVIAWVFVFWIVCTALGLLFTVPQALGKLERGSWEDKAQLLIEKENKVQNEHILFIKKCEITDVKFGIVNRGHNFDKKQKHNPNFARESRITSGNGFNKSPYMNQTTRDHRIK